jgi:hypothetical protein
VADLLWLILLLQIWLLLLWWLIGHLLIWLLIWLFRVQIRSLTGLAFVL